MRMRSDIVATFLILWAGVGSTSGAQDEFTRTDKTGWWWYHNASVDDISLRIQEKKARIIRIERDRLNPSHFNVVMVANQGVYAKKWWWYTGLNPDQLKLKLAENSARLLDLDAYFIDGELRFAAVMVDNTGAQGKAWWWMYGGSDDVVASQYNSEKARLIALTAWDHLSGTEYVRRYAAAMIANQGADAKQWWWYKNVSSDFVKATLIENKAQLIDIERSGDGKWNVIMEKSNGPAGWWYYGKTANEVESLAKQNGARVVGITSYPVNDERRYGVIMVKNQD